MNTISKRIFNRLDELNMTQQEFSNRTGINPSTISEWKKNGTNPSSDKIMAICRALEITPEQLLTGEGIDDVTEFKPITERAYADRTDAKLLEDYHGMQEDQKKRLLAYVEALKKIESLEDLK